jgi:hypothetical protein
MMMMCGGEGAKRGVAFEDFTDMGGVSNVKDDDDDDDR